MLSAVLQGPRRGLEITIVLFPGIPRESRGASRGSRALDEEAEQCQGENATQLAVETPCPSSALSNPVMSTLSSPY